jgi:hypothetical protein
MAFMAACGGGDANATPPVEAGSESGVAESGAESAADTSSDAPGGEASAIPDASEASVDGSIVDATDAAKPEVDAPQDGPADTGSYEDAPAHCYDNRLDADETDVDCGGSCPACWRGQHCLGNSDCSLSAPACDPRLGCACDATTLTCVYDHCVDHKKDSTESDVDCGGSDCPQCATGLACVTNNDCASRGCDGITSTCAVSACADHKQDWSEVAVDCGGGACPGCALGLHCELDYDCLSLSCDALSLVCTADQCTNHRQDGQETDIDCGGPVCAARCQIDRQCMTTADCAMGLSCSPPLPQICH